MGFDSTLIIYTCCGFRSVVKRAEATGHALNLDKLPP
jgi:hypothetical protein